MEKAKGTQDVKTNHSNIYKSSNEQQHTMVTLDSPDDRITKQTGDGTTLVKNDSPDDMEDKLVK